MAIDTWDVFVTDNGRETVDLLNGVSAIIYGNSLNGLILTIMAIGLLVITLRFAFTGGWQGALQWFIVSTMVLFALVAPKKPVLVQDYSDPFLARVVEDVPIGLAAIMSFSTVAGDRLVRIFETAYGTVAGSPAHNGFQYSTGGMLAAERTLGALMNTDAQDTRVIANVNNFLGNCVYPNITRNNKFDELTKHGNLPEYFGTVTSSALVYYRPASTEDTVGVPAWKQCRDAAPLVQADLMAEADRSIARVGKIIHPSLDAAEATSQYTTDLGFTADKFLGISHTGPQMISQVMSINMIKRSLTQEAASGGEAALMDFVNAQASVQSRLTMASVGGLMQTALPKMHSVLVMILISVFPIVVVMAFLPGGGGIIKNYFLFYLNLQVWPLMFSIFTRIIEAETAERALAIAQASAGEDATNALNMTALDPLLQIPSETSAIALMMIGLIPGIAVMLTKGYSAVAGQVQNTLRPISVATETAAAAGATGNISLKNANLGNSSINNHTRDQIKQSPSVDVGQFHGVTKSGAGYTVAQNGSVIVRGHEAQGTGAYSADVSSYAESAINKRKADAHSLRQTSTEEYGSSLGAATTDLVSAAYTESEGRSADITKGHDISESSRNSISQTWRDAAKYAEDNNLSGAAELRELQAITAEGKLSVGANFFGTGVSTSLGASQTRDGSKAARAQSAISSYLSREGNEDQAHNYANALSEVQASRQKTSTGSALSETQSAAANLTAAENFRESAVLADNRIASLETAFNQNSGSRETFNKNVMGRAQSIVQEQGGASLVAEVFGSRPEPGSRNMEIQDAAIRQAVNEEIGHTLNHHSDAHMQIGSVSGPSRNREDVQAAHGVNSGNVGTFGSQNAVLSGGERTDVNRSFGENQERHAERMNQGRTLQSDVIKKQGNQDIMREGDSIASTTAALLPAQRAQDKLDRMEQINELQAQQPTETVKSWSFSSGYDSEHMMRTEVERPVPLTDDQIAAIPEVGNGSLADTFGAFGSGLVPERPPGARPAGVGFNGDIPGTLTETLTGTNDNVADHREEFRDTMRNARSLRNRGGADSGSVDTGAVNRSVDLSDRDLQQSAAAISSVMGGGVFDRSAAENREYGGLVYRDQNGDIHATQAVAGFTDSDGRLAFNPSDAEHLVPAGAEVIGDYHTHGRAGGNGEFSQFSLSDIQGINNDNDRNGAYAGGFLVNPQGDLSFYSADSLSGNISTSDIAGASIGLGSLQSVDTSANQFGVSTGSGGQNFSLRHQDGAANAQAGGVFGFAAKDHISSVENAFEGRAAALGADGHSQFSSGDELIQLFDDSGPISEAHIASHGWTGGVIGADPTVNEGFYTEPGGGDSPGAAYVNDFVTAVEAGNIELDNGARINFYGCNLDELASRMSTELTAIGRDDIRVMGADSSVGASDQDGNGLDDTLRVWNMRNDNFNTYEGGEVVDTTNEIRFSDQGR